MKFNEEHFWDELMKICNREAFRECPECGHTLNPFPIDFYKELVKRMDVEGYPIILACHNCKKIYVVIMMDDDNDNPSLTELKFVRKNKK